MDNTYKNLMSWQKEFDKLQYDVIIQQPGRIDHFKNKRDILILKQTLKLDCNSFPILKALIF